MTDDRTSPNLEPVPPGDPTAADDRHGAVRVGVSACLLGREVRYDGGHKHDRFVTDVLGEHVTFVPVCPEVEIGLTIPRPNLRLVEDADGDARLIVEKTGEDLTDKMRTWAADRLESLAARDLSGFILKNRSPSCGMERVKLYPGNPDGMPEKKAVGTFAAELLRTMPQLPVEEEGRLNDPLLRENFVVRIFAHRRVTDLFAGEWTRADLVEFHTREKQLLLAHDPERSKELGRIVAAVADREPDEIADAYRREFLAALARPVSRGRHVNVLQHMAGFFKDLGDTDRRLLHRAIDDFAAGLAPLVVPMTLLHRHAEVHDVDWLRGQTYLEPHPRELVLRAHP